MGLGFFGPKQAQHLFWLGRWMNSSLACSSIGIVSSIRKPFEECKKMEKKIIDWKGFARLDSIMNAENKKEGEVINQEMEKYDEAREQIIKELRAAQKASKAAVYALQKRDLAGAKAKIAIAEGVIRNFLPTVSANPDLRRGTFSAAVEEFVEAKAFETFLEDNSLIQKSAFEGLSVTNEEYLGGISDLVGEMIRFSVLEATKRNVEAVRHCRDLTDDILAGFMQFNLKNGMLRKKSDSVKYGLKRFEEILYDLSLKVPEGKRLDAADFDERDTKKIKTDDE
jgi:predicted translin family RNA/ssDNA-binding protein